MNLFLLSNLKNGMCIIIMAMIGHIIITTHFHITKSEENNLLKTCTLFGK